MIGGNEDDGYILAAEIVVKDFDVLDRVFVADKVNQQVDAAIKRTGETVKVAQSFTR